MSYSEEFPNFKLDVIIPEGFRDTSWHNDICPSWEMPYKMGINIKLWIDYPEDEDRELDTPRFTVCLYSMETEQYIDLVHTEYYQEALACISNLTD